MAGRSPMTAHAVIGAFYGDEGKGLVTDYLANKLGGPNVVVVRSNGGAQAAHTVQTPEGLRHVFHHFSSGTFVGARTHLSQFMIINPIAFNEEWDALEAMGIKPVVTVDPTAMVTTPFDMLINQAMETVRSSGKEDERHGSCGLGINETVERDEYSEDYRLRAADLVFPNKMIATLGRIKEHWVARRWEHLAYVSRKSGAVPMPEEYARLVTDHDVMTNYFVECAQMLRRIDFVEDKDALKAGGEEIIFEGAQGLLLDEHFGEMPFCTRSCTGLRNVSKLCDLMGIDDITVYYVMRAYTTRHGAGPLLDECKPETIGVQFSDPTNVFNPWQQEIRVAPLHINNMTVILDDRDSVRSTTKVRPVVVVTCMDQVTGSPQVNGLFNNWVPNPDPIAVLGGQVAETYGQLSMDLLTSWGPTRETIQRHVIEYYRLGDVESADAMQKLCDINGIKYARNRTSMICCFDTEEERQLIRLASSKQLTKRVSAL
jgi:adenylosuccinate synthase